MKCEYTIFLYFLSKNSVKPPPLGGGCKRILLKLLVYVDI